MGKKRDKRRRETEFGAEFENPVAADGKTEPEPEPELHRASSSFEDETLDGGGAAGTGERPASLNGSSNKRVELYEPLPRLSVEAQRERLDSIMTLLNPPSERASQAAMRIQAAARGRRARTDTTGDAGGALAARGSGLANGTLEARLEDDQRSLRFELEKLDVDEVLRHAMDAGLAERDVDFARNGNSSAAKANLIELMLYADSKEVTDINVEFKFVDDDKSSPRRKKSDKIGSRFTRLRRVKDEFLGTTKDGRLKWSWKYTIDGKEFLMGKSFGLWAQDSPFRQAVFVFMANRWVELTILLCILLQTFFLVLAIPGDMDWLERGIFPEIQWLTDNMDHAFLVIYVVEMLLRMIALGVYKGKYSYVRSSWNLLDGTLVFLSVGNFILELLGLTHVINPSMMRIVRCIRPLRTAHFVHGVQSALKDWQFLVHIGLLLIFSMTMFGVMGVQLFGGALSLGCATEQRLDAGSWSDLVDISNSSSICPTMLACEDDLCVPNPQRIIGAGIWGYDNIGQAMLSGWIATTGDMYSPNMIKNLGASSALYSGSAWFFCILMVLFLQLIIGHLFSAVVVHSFLTDSGTGHDVAAIERRIWRQKQVFTRIDHDHSGEIESTELWNVTTTLGLDALVSFADHEIHDAISEMDPSGDGAVDFEEFSHFWSANGSFVVKLKKALKLQEEEIRKVWVLVDGDGDNSLGLEELQDLGMHLGIKLTHADVDVMIEEMDARAHGVNYKLFCKWWFSDSRVAAKVKRATLKKSDAPIKMFRRMDIEKDGFITVEDIEATGRTVFGHALSRTEAAEIIEDCLQRESTSSVNSADKDRMLGKVSLPVFESWWVSTKKSATAMRHKRQEDIAKAKAVLAKYDLDGEGDGTGTLELPELEGMCRKLKIGATGQQVLESIVISNAEVQGTHFDGLDTLAVGALSESHHESVTFEELFDWMRSAQPLATRVREEFARTAEKDEQRAKRPFLFIPGLSPLCRDIVYSARFEHVMTGIIIISTVAMAAEFHEIELTQPTLKEVLDGSEIVFSVLYVVEFVLKVLGMGFKDYLHDLGNRFDFCLVALLLLGFVLPDVRKATAFRGLRVLVRSLRVLKAAKIIVNNEKVMTLLKTILESGWMLLMLSLFACFMLVVLTIIAGHTLGTCHLRPDGEIDPFVEHKLPKLNFYRFSDGFHANFLIMMGESWAAIMFHYQECHPRAWLYFVICYCVMNFFIANLFVALIVEGFCLSAEEKMIKQEKHHLEAIAEQGGIMKEFAATETSLGGKTLNFMRDGGAQEMAFGAVKQLPKPQNVMKMMSRGARAQKLTGPMGAMKREMGRRVPVDLGQLQKIKDAAEDRARRAKEEVQKHAEATMKKAQDAAEAAGKRAMEEAKKAGEAGIAKAREAREIAEALAEDQIAEAKKKMKEKMDDFNREDLELSALEVSPEDRKKMMSYNVFTLENPIRKRCISLVEAAIWDNAVVVVILLSSVLIAVDGPPGAKPLIDGDPETVRTTLHVLNGAFLVVFWLEFCVKTIAEGLIRTPGAYINDAWNRMDLCVLLISTFEYFSAGSNDSPGVARIMRVLRLIRPLRLMKSNESMQVLIDAMGSVVPIMIGVLGLMFIFFTTFAIFGMGLFMGKFYRCNCEGKFGLPVMNCTDHDYRALNMTACVEQGGSWENPPFNFDDFFSSLRTLYFCSNGGGWIDIIQSGMDVTDVYAAPSTGESKIFVTYFWAFIIFNRLFVVNVFIGILTNYFLEANGAALLTESQTSWAQCQIICLWETPYMSAPPPSGTFKRIVYDVIDSSYFDPTITLALVINVGSLLWETVPMDPEVHLVLAWIQVVCLYLFSVELAARAWAYGWTPYWRDHWNKIDVVIVATSWLSSYEGSFEGLEMLRGIRILRVLMLARKVRGLRPLTRTLLVSLPGCFNVCVLLTLFICIFAVGAMNLFGGIGTDHDTINEVDNFDNFPNSFAYLVQMCIAGQDFVNVIYELDNLNKLQGLGAPGAFFFFTIYNLITQWLILNMVVVVLVDNFIKSFSLATMDIQEEHIAEFKEVWCEGVTDAGGEFWGEPFTVGPDHKTINARKLQELVPQLLPPTEARDISFQQPSVHAFISSITHNQFSNHSPLGLVVPHLIKHKNSTAAPFAEGTLAHIDGRLVEIIGIRWDSDITAEQARQENVPPDFVEVNFIESEEIDSDRVVSEDGLHVPPVERFTGFLEDKPVTITWVSNDRKRVRVQFGETTKHKHKRRNVRLQKLQSEDTPSWLRSSTDIRELEMEQLRETEEYFTAAEAQERADAATKIQAIQRGGHTRQRLKRERREFILAKRENEKAQKLQALRDAEKKVLYVFQVVKKAAIRAEFEVDSEQISWLEVGELVNSYEARQDATGNTRHRVVVQRKTSLRQSMNDIGGAVSPRGRQSPRQLEGWVNEKTGGDAILVRRGDKMRTTRVSVDEHGAFDEFPAHLVMKVTPSGDNHWLNRLALELGISQQELADGFRYLPPTAKLTDDKGKFLPVVVGLRSLPDGTFVQDVEVTFHEVLLALCLIHMSYDGLSFAEKQGKLEEVKERAQHYAARVFQCCARAKFAKRHLLKQPEHVDPSRTGPLQAWALYHKR